MLRKKQDIDIRNIRPGKLFPIETGTSTLSE
jgi:hypothetical protein